MLLGLAETHPKLTALLMSGQPYAPPGHLATRWHLTDLIPRGVGNKEIVATAPFREAARHVTEAIARIASEMSWKIERVAIDAPAAPPSAGSRLAEDELGHIGLSSFRTPTVPAWADIRRKCADHLVNDDTASTLPHANKIWMLFGFELFIHLRKELGVEIIEVYPFEIVRTLLPTCRHKSTEQGYREQLEAVAIRTGWQPQDLEAKLKATLPGSRHDRLDAFMAAWVASMPQKARRALVTLSGLMTRSGCLLQTSDSDRALTELINAKRNGETTTAKLERLTGQRKGLIEIFLAVPNRLPQQ